MHCRRTGSRIAHCCGVLVGLAQAGCVTPLHHWQDQGLSPDQVVERERPDVVRVTRMDGSRLVVREPWASADTLFGAAADSAVALPLSEIARLAVRRRGPSPPIQAGAALAGLGVLIWPATWDPFGS